MTDHRDAWKNVSAQFTELGRRIRGHYDPPSSGEKAPDTQPDPEQPIDVDPRIKQTLDRVADAVDRIADALTDTAKDPEIRENAATAASSILDALGATFHDLGDEFRKTVDRSRARRHGEPPHDEEE